MHVANRMRTHTHTQTDARTDMREPGYMYRIGLLLEFPRDAISGHLLKTQISASRGWKEYVNHNSESVATHAFAFVQICAGCMHGEGRRRRSAGCMGS